MSNAKTSVVLCCIHCGLPLNHDIHERIAHGDQASISEHELRTLYTSQGVPIAKQHEIVLGVQAKATPEALAALAAMFADHQRFDKGHVCSPDTCPEPASYYVSAVDGPKWYPMAGPYPTHKEALRDVGRSRDIASDNDGRAWFMAWGTVRLSESYREPGRLNAAYLI